jgi:acyl-CoA hydrolase
MTHMVLPNEANPLGALLGGTLMHWIDLTGALAGHRHAHSLLVTASIDQIDFRIPVQVGEIVILRASVNRAFRTSLEVGVKVWRETLAGDRAHVSSAYLTFVAIDRAFRPHPVPRILPETEEQKRRYQDAGRRREIRQAEIARKKAARSSR